MPGVPKQLVSVVIPVRNRPHGILRALKSVYAQSYNNMEIIVIDDCSTDGTIKAIEEHYPEVNIKENKERVGGAIARNQGAKMAKGEFLAFLDSDDEWFPDHLDKSVNFLSKANLHGVFAFFSISYDQGATWINPNMRKKHVGENVLNYIIASNDGGDIRTSTLVFRTKSFLSVMFDEDFKKYQDWDLAIRFDRRFQLHSLSERTAMLHVAAEDRMSAKLNLDATKLFYLKHKEYFPSKLIFDFFIKLCYKAALVGSRRNKEFNYFIDEASKHYKLSPSVSNKLKLIALKIPFINVARLYYNVKRRFD